MCLMDEEKIDVLMVLILRISSSKLTITVFQSKVSLNRLKSLKHDLLIS